MTLLSLSGLLSFPLIAWALSENRGTLNKRLIAWTMGLQFLFALIVFRSDSGKTAFLWLNDGVKAVVDASMAGPKFVFGPLALDLGATDPTVVGSGIGFVLAFQALPTILVFSALIAILYYVGIMQLLIRGFAYVFTRLMHISGAESLSAASNIFVGVESALVIRPHLARMTRSELCTVLSVCMATVASNVLASYVLVLQGVFPSIAGHLISASILSAPAALLMSKLICPETDSPETLGQHVDPHYEKPDSLFAAVIDASQSGLQLVLGIAALLITVVGLLGILNMGMRAVGGEAFTVQGILAYPFAACALLMGVARDDIWSVAQLLSQRVVATEFTAYFGLKALIAGGTLSPRSAVIASYALCGFAHIPSIAIFVGGISALVPERKADLARVAWRAFLAATLACCMTGAMAGLFYDSSTSVLATKAVPVGSAAQ